MVEAIPVERKVDLTGGDSGLSAETGVDPARQHIVWPGVGYLSLAQTTLDDADMRALVAYLEGLK